MTYIQPDAETQIHLIREHEVERERLKLIDQVVDFKINNPVLITQRDKVRRLKDKILLAEAHILYPFLKKNRCTFPYDSSCEIEINHSFYAWVVYGNCCKTCNQKYNRVNPLPLGAEEPRFIKPSAWDDLELL